ncbi:MAG: hypothetical protein JWQ40_3104 [Segetibacter sp.]|nr:hypothetical protein [Segetibacter sp.]
MRLLLIITFAVLSIGISNAQDKNDSKEDKKARIQRLIESRNFVFVARSANPMGGNFINLTSLYDVRVSSDTLKSDLPYFGRAFVAPVNPTESALRFTSTDFNYITKARKKGGWDITITPKDGKDVRQMNLTVSDNGYAMLQVMSNNRQPITFNGSIEEKNRR